MRKLVGSILACGAILALSLNLLHAQTSGGVNFDSNLALVQSVVPDSIVQILAESAGLPLIPPAEAPRTATYWWILPSGTAVPAPCPPLDLSAPIFQMASGQFVVDETGGAVPTIPRRSMRQAQTAGTTTISPLELEATTVADLILRVQPWGSHSGKTW